MTKSARAWAWEVTEVPFTDGSRRKLTGPQKTVLVALAELESYEYGYAYPSLAYLARRCCIGLRTVDAALKVLESLNLISRSKQERSPETGKWERNNYYLNVPDAFREKDKTWMQIGRF